MDEHLETSWCPVCDKLIQPLRYTVQLDAHGNPLQPQPSSSTTTTAQELSTTTSSSPAPTSAPAEPEVTRKTASARAGATSSKSKRTTSRGAHGLVHGTGRVRPGGGLRLNTSEDASAAALAPAPVRTTRSAVVLPPPPPPSPASVRPATFPPKMRTLISQAQTPLYCSERCRLIDDRRRAAIQASNVVIGPRKPQSALNESPVSFDAFLLPPATHPAVRRASDSSNGTDVSSLFDSAPRRSSLDENEIPDKHPKKPADLLPKDTTSIIREALVEWRAKQPKPKYGEQQERVAPGWRAGDTAWRKIVYGDFDPKPRPQMPPREPTPPPSPVLPVDPANLGPFDRRPNPALPPPDPFAAQRELLAKMTFARVPSSTALPSCPETTLSVRSRSRNSASSIASRPSLSTAFSYRSRSSNERSQTSHDDDYFTDSENEFVETRIKPSGRSDRLSRQLEESARERAREEYAAKHKEFLAREEEEARRLRATCVEPRSLQEHIALKGPIMGRRAAGVSSSAPQHSWSFENLPRHIPLYPMPGMSKLRTESRSNDGYGDLDFEPTKRLFLFGGASSSTSSPAPRRHSALAFSS